MKINAAKFYSSLFTVLLLLQLYLPSFKLNLVVQIVVIAVFMFMEKTAFSVFFLKQIKPLFLLFVLGFVGAVIYRPQLFDVIRDISHYIKPITGLLIGYLFYRRIDNEHLFFKTIVIAGVISAIIHLGIIKVLAGTGSISEIREFTKDNFLELFSIFVLLFYSRYTNEKLFNNIIYVAGALLVLAISSMLYFSRTMIVLAIVMGLSVFGYTIITKKTLRIVVGLFVFIGLFYAYLHTANIRRNGKGFEQFLYKVKIAPEEIYKTNINTDDHRKLWDHWRAYEAGRAVHLMTEHPGSFVYGTGFGSLVNLRFFAPLTGERKGIRYISELHNGYIYIFYKVGTIGLLIYLFMLARWYKFLYRDKTFVSVMVSATGLIFFVTTITITGIYNNRDIIVFLLGGLLYFSERERKEVTS